MPFSIDKRNIIFEDNHLLVVDKPAGIATMGAIEGEPTVAELAKEYLKRTYNKPGNVYLGIVSRLDARVSGVIVFARTSKAAARLNEQFKNRTTKKSYRAIVSAAGQGQRSLDRLPDHGTLEHWVYKDEPAHRMRCLAQDTPAKKLPRDAKNASLSWTKIGHDKQQTLVEVKLHTGRKHQIRCQFAFAGFPVVGDKKYGSSAKFSGKGIALHSQSLEITHPTLKSPMEFQAKVPESWNVAKFIV